LTAGIALLSPEVQLVATLRRASGWADTCLESREDVPVLVCDMVLAAQQAAALALCAVGDRIPEQAGATELLLRAASPARLPAPYTLPLPRSMRRDFEALVAARNAIMHPRGACWQILPMPLSAGLKASLAIIRHLILIQPVLADLVSPQQGEAITRDLVAVDALAEFLDDSALT
jgi:hypothetical protein